MQYRTVRIRPFRKANMQEAGYIAPEGLASQDLTELWIGGQLEAVLCPERKDHKLIQQQWGSLDPDLIETLSNHYLEIVRVWEKKVVV